jgi:hypothetical protein
MSQTCNGLVMSVGSCDPLAGFKELRLPQCHNASARSISGCFACKTSGAQSFRTSPMGKESVSLSIAMMSVRSAALAMASGVGQRHEFSYGFQNCDPTVQNGFCEFLCPFSLPVRCPSVHSRSILPQGNFRHELDDCGRKNLDYTQNPLNERNGLF